MAAVLITSFPAYVAVAIEPPALLSWSELPATLAVSSLPATLTWQSLPFALGDSLGNTIVDSFGNEIAVF